MHFTRIDHVSFTVGDLDLSRSFYERFGFQPKQRFDSAGPHVDRAAEVADADMEIQWLGHVAGGPMLELIRYVHHPADNAAHNSIVGAAHVCLTVEDLATAHQELVEAGVHVNSEPNVDASGTRWMYLRDPDGNIVELIQNPD